MIDNLHEILMVFIDIALITFIGLCIYNLIFVRKFIKKQIEKEKEKNDLRNLRN